MKDIYIIGGNSYIGYELTTYLSIKYEKSKIFSVSRNLIQFKENNIDHITLEKFIKSNKKINNALVYYFISQDRSECAISKEYIDVNIGIFIDCITKFKNSKIIYLSTFSVYNDNWDFKKINENSDLNFTHPYASSHYTCEMLGKKLCYQFSNEFIIGRLTNSFGWVNRHYGERYVLNSLLSSAITNNNVILKSDGLFYRDFIFIGDVVNILDNLKNKPNNQILNICSNKTYLVRDIAYLIKSLAEEINETIVELHIQNELIHEKNEKGLKTITKAKVETIYDHNIKMHNIKEALYKSMINLKKMI